MTESTSSAEMIFVEGMEAVKSGVQFVHNKAPEIIENLSITGGDFEFRRYRETEELLIKVNPLYLSTASTNNENYYVVPSGFGPHVLPGLESTFSDDEILHIAPNRTTIITLSTIEEAGHALYSKTNGISEQYSTKASCLARYDAQPEEMFSLFLQLEYLKKRQSQTLTQQNLERRLKNAVLYASKNSQLEKIIDKYIRQDFFSESEQFALAVIRGKDYTTQTVPQSVKDLVKTIKNLGVAEIPWFGTEIAGNMQWSIKLPSTSFKKDLSTEFSIITHPGNANFEVIIKGYNYVYRVEFENGIISIEETRNDDLGDKHPQRYKNNFHPQLKNLIENGIQVFEELSAIAGNQINMSINGKPIRIVKPLETDVLNNVKQLTNYIAPLTRVNESLDGSIITPTVSIISPNYLMHSTT